MVKLRTHIVLNTGQSVVIAGNELWYDYTSKDPILTLVGENRVTVKGDIAGGLVYGGEGMFVSGSHNLISITATAQITGYVGIDTDFAATDTRIVNAGTVAGGYIGVGAYSLRCAVTNRGEVFGHFGIYTSLHNAAIISNSGLIEGEKIGILATDTFSATTTRTTITNSGQIVGGDWGISSTYEGTTTDGFGNVTLVNSGTISGRLGSFVAAKMGADSVTNSGTMIGNVRLEGGDDIYTATATGRVQGTILGGAGRDSITGGAFEDAMDGGGGNDTLSGGGESDLLIGRTGKDVLIGGDGNDRLVGGADNDTLSGSAGGDTFVFDIQNGNDVVMDFENGIDKIDIHAFGIDPANFATAVLPFFSAVSGGIVLDLGGLGAALGQITFQGLTLSDIDVSDFIF